jgi:hypothetical protein
MAARINIIVISKLAATDLFSPTTSPVTIETGLPGNILATSWRHPGDIPDFASFA